MLLHRHAIHCGHCFMNTVLWMKSFISRKFRRWMPNMTFFEKKLFWRQWVWKKLSMKVLIQLVPLGEWTPESSAYVSMCHGKVKEERVSRESVITQREGPHQTTIKTLWSWTLQLQNDKKVSLCCFIQLAVLWDSSTSRLTLCKLYYVHFRQWLDYNKTT